MTNVTFLNSGDTILPLFNNLAIGDFFTISTCKDALYIKTKIENERNNAICLTENGSGFIHRSFPFDLKVIYIKNITITRDDN